MSIPWDVDTEGLKEYMSKFGELEDCFVIKVSYCFPFFSSVILASFSYLIYDFLWWCEICQVLVLHFMLQAPLFKYFGEKIQHVYANRVK